MRLQPKNFEGQSMFTLELLNSSEVEAFEMRSIGTLDQLLDNAAELGLRSHLGVDGSGTPPVLGNLYRAVFKG